MSATTTETMARPIDILLVRTGAPAEAWLRRVLIELKVDFRAGELSNLGPRVACDVLVFACPPRRSPLELARLLRRASGEAGILACTPGDASAAAGLLEGGADAWIAASSEPALVRGSLSALVRRVLSDFAPHDDAIFVSETNNTVRIAGQVIPMRRAEFRICAYLIENRGRWISERELLHNVLEMRHDRETSLVRVHVRRIRKALGACARFLQSKRLIGYRFAFPALAEELSENHVARE